MAVSEVRMWSQWTLQLQCDPTGALWAYIARELLPEFGGRAFLPYLSITGPFLSWTVRGQSLWEGNSPLLSISSPEDNRVSSYCYQPIFTTAGKGEGHVSARKSAVITVAEGRTDGGGGGPGRWTERKPVSPLLDITGEVRERIKLALN